MSGDAGATVEPWQREAATRPIEWTGDLNGDCSALWAGLMLRAEEMSRTSWVWAVYDERTGKRLSGSGTPELMARSGKKARAQAEQAARAWIEGSP
jgi:hypothetical protein